MDKQTNKGKCNNPDCTYPTGKCHELHETPETGCEYWESSIKMTKTKQSNENKSNIDWLGGPFQENEISKISYRNSPIIIGVIGKADAGKTSFLGMLYTLLHNGNKLKEYNFAGSKTIIGWEELAHGLRINKGEVSFPSPTPTNPDYCSLYHLALRDNENKLKDILIPDISGEIFIQWAYDRNAENAKWSNWIHDNSNCFIFFIDCEALSKTRNAAKTEIIDIARQLNENLNNRPVVVVWSKSDVIENIKDTIKNSLKNELQSFLKNYIEIEVSNFSKADPDELCHHNNLEVLNWLLNKTMQPSNLNIESDRIKTDDFFLNYRG